MELFTVKYLEFMYILLYRREDTFRILNTFMNLIKIYYLVQEERELVK